MKHTKTTTLMIAALALAACSGSSGAPATTVSESSIPTTEPAISTTTSIAGAGTTPESTTTSTTIPADPVMPLLGTPITDPALAARPALVVKIDNHPDARPQSGLNQADIVFEENVEHLTRFAAVFQSQNPDPVGPIRSGRTQDVMLLGSLNKPIFAWSGGNAGVTAAINGSDFVVANVQSNARKAAQSYRSRDRGVPHNLYAQGSGLFTMAPALAGPPPLQFTYRKDAAALGDPSAGADLAMDGVNVSWKFDASKGIYLRFQAGKAHNDAALGQLNAANVVVVVVDYRPSPADGNSPEAQTTGTGETFVFSAGKVVHGKWTRPDRLTPFQLTGDDGKPILLTPGRTWVELARADATKALPA